MLHVNYFEEQLNRLSQSLIGLEQACHEAQIAINEVVLPLFEAEQRRAREAEIRNVQLELVKEALAEKKPNFADYNHRYQEQLKHWYHEFIEQYRELLSNKDRPYLFKDGKLIKINANNREHYVQTFIVQELDALIKAHEDFTLDSITDLQNVVDELQQRLLILENINGQSQQDRVNLYSQRAPQLDDLIKQTYEKRQELTMEYFEKNIWVACEKGDLISLDKLIKQEWYFNRKKLVNQTHLETGDTLAHVAARCGHIKILQLLQSYGAKIEAVNKYDYGLLHLAVKGQHLDMVKYLILTAQMNINALGEFGRTPLHIAAYEGHELMVRFLLEQKARVNVKVNKEQYEQTPLHMAASRGHVKTVQWLLRFRANPRVVNTHGETPLMEAVLSNQPAVVKVFFNEGVWLSHDQVQSLQDTAKRIKNPAMLLSILPPLRAQIELVNYSMQQLLGIHSADEAVTSSEPVSPIITEANTSNIPIKQSAEFVTMTQHKEANIKNLADKLGQKGMFKVLPSIGPKSLEKVSNRTGLNKTLRLRLATQLPAELKPGKALDAGDCFFDACAQAINAMPNQQDEYTAKSLRILCHDYALKIEKTSQLDKQHNWIYQAFLTETRQDAEQASRHYQDYMANISYTADEKQKGYGLNEELARWGSDIDGRIIAKALKLQLHIIELHDNPQVIAHQLINGDGNHSIENFDYTIQDAIHLAVGLNHFVPVLPVKNLRPTNNVANDTINTQPQLGY